MGEHFGFFYRGGGGGKYYNILVDVESLQFFLKSAYICYIKEN